jgi:DNA-binding MurR/RpiR family transcriptional regulator
MQEILDRLPALMPELSPHMRRVARCVLDNPNEVAVTSMRALAVKAQVTPPTMVRFARHLGFSNYESFRAIFQDSVTRGGFRQKATSLRELGERSGIAGVARRMMETTNENINRLFGANDLDQLNRAADLLASAPACYVMGIGALHWMSTYLQYLGRAVLPQMRVPRANGNSLIEGIIAVEAGDVMLIMSVSPYAKPMVEAAQFARSRGAKVVAITDSHGSPLALAADIIFVVGAETPQFYPSMIGVVALIEMIVALIVSKGDAATLERIATIDKLRRKENAYFDL